MIKTKRVPYETPKPCGHIEGKWGLKVTLNNIVYREYGKILFVTSESCGENEPM